MCTAPTTRMGRFAANWRRNTSQLFELAIKPAPAGFVFSRAPHHLRARLCGAPVVHARTEKGSLLDRSRTVAEAEAVRERDGACALVATQSDRMFRAKTRPVEQPTKRPHATTTSVSLVTQCDTPRTQPAFVSNHLGG